MGVTALSFQIRPSRPSPILEGINVNLENFLRNRRMCGIEREMKSAVGGERIGGCGVTQIRG